jgi:hypothetical protein
LNISIRSTQTVLKDSEIEFSENRISKFLFKLDNARDSGRLNENSASNWRHLMNLGATSNWQACPRPDWDRFHAIDSVSEINSNNLGMNKKTNKWKLRRSLDND